MRERREQQETPYVLVMTRGQSIENLQSHVGFTNPAKGATLARIVASYKRYLKKS